MGEPLSATDRSVWERRYRQGAYASREHPSPWLLRWFQEAPQGAALDVACGAGRNAIFLAERGFAVTGVDISPTALARAAASAGARGVAARWLGQDLDDGLDVAGPFALIAMIRYVDIGLMKALAKRLAPGGLLVCEQHLRGEGADAGGPKNPAFRVPPGELLAAAASLDILGYREGPRKDPDGRRMALAQLAARLGSGSGRGGYHGEMGEGDEAVPNAPVLTALAHSLPRTFPCEFLQADGGNHALGLSRFGPCRSTRHVLRLHSCPAWRGGDRD